MSHRTTSAVRGTEKEETDRPDPIARSGDATTIAGYMGKSDVFDRAITRVAEAYADQTERD